MVRDGARRGTRRCAPRARAGALSFVHSTPEVCPPVPNRDRKLEVLRAIVEDFISTNEPVGSKALADRHNLGVSPATIRNDMAALEEDGLIAQPHTSAGRVPTDAGYRMFVDRLTQLRSEERRVGKGCRARSAACREVE